MTQRTIAEIINEADLNKLPAAFRAIALGTLLAGEGGLRLVRETVAVTSDAAAPSYTVKRLLSAKVSGGSAGNGEKTCQSNGDTGERTMHETLAVASAAATPTFAIDQLLRCKTVGTGAAGAKAPGINGATPGTGAAAPNSAGTSLVFNAETTGTGTALVSYLTSGGCATPNSGGTSVAFKASEVTGANAVVELLYLTSDPPANESGVTYKSLSDTLDGVA